MTAPSPLLDLDDAASVAAADSEGVMRSAALGGAQVRATAAAVTEGALDRIKDMRPRSVVMVTGGGRAGRAATVLIATAGPKVGIPILHLPAVPPWVGPLDVVVVAGDDAGDNRLLDAADSAMRRGAEVVLVAPDEGPLRAVGAGRAMALPPRVRVPDRNGFLRYLAAGLAVVATLESGRTAGLFPDLAELADELDAEAVRDRPDNEVFHNPAKSLAVRMRGRRVVLAGDGPSTTALARHGAEVLLRTAGVVAAAADLGEVVAASDRIARGGGASGGDYDPIFHDEELDGPAPSAPVRVLVLATAASRQLTARRIAVLPDADLVTMGDEDSIEMGDGEMRGPQSRERTEVEQLAVTAVRLEMAAAYLHLIGGS
ncbi:tobH protein [Rhodococcus spelaei]|uniref:TobH protein n=1 Tax=Rhodococcus spelaei TaxID=2546320 RepID=A0A541B170_9NOCA|nr:tobH protein [Rhodococcus spelaei]TQF66054.1 tobH protein [Rhodococcus spelaei]